MDFNSLKDIIKKGIVVNNQKDIIKKNIVINKQKHVHKQDVSTKGINKNPLNKIFLEKITPNRVLLERIRKKKKIFGCCSIVFIITIVVLVCFNRENRLVSKASCDEEAKIIQDLLPLDDKDTKNITKPVATFDVVQPWLFTNQEEAYINQYVKMLSEAGYKNIILQNVCTVSGGEKNDARITCAWYPTKLVEDANMLEVYQPEVLLNLMSALEKYDMGIYIGLCFSNDWWRNAFENKAWRYSNILLTNQVAQDIYNQVGKHSSFKGWHMGFEIYNNDKGYEKYWIEMLNYTMNFITKLESNLVSHPIILSATFDKTKQVKPISITNMWQKIISKVNFRPNDIICVEDCLANVEYQPSVVLDYIKTTKDVITKSKKGIQFMLNVDNYRDIDTSVQPADVARYTLQLQICSKYAKTLASTSYSHYYNPNFVSPIYADEYRKHIKSYK